MSLHFSIIQVLKDNSSKTKTMTVPQIRNEIVKIINPNISEVSKTDIPTIKMVRTSLNSLLEQDRENIIKYTETYRKDGSPYRSKFYIEQPNGAEFKFLMDSVLYSPILNKDIAQNLIAFLEKIGGKPVSKYVPYKDLFKLKYKQKIDVIKNIAFIMKAIEHQRKINFTLYVYNTDLKLEKYREIKNLNPLYIIMNNSKYYLLGSYNQSKIYSFRLDLMDNFKETTEIALKLDYFNEIKDRDWSKYMHEHPYMITGDVINQKLRVNKSIFTQIVDWFGSDIKVYKNTETDKTIDVTVRASENALKYWLLQYGENVKAIDMSDNLKKSMQNAAEIIYQNYGENF